jgi:cytoskeletal protein CcmA (bactofilin family)
MKSTLIKLLLIFVALLPWGVMSNNFTWTGAVSSDWNDPLNWSPNGVPSAISDNVTINTNSPNVCILDINRAINILTVNNASFQLSGRQLTVSNQLIVQNGANVSGGSIVANSIQLSNSSFLNLHLTKTGNVNDNNINGNSLTDFEFINNSNNRAWFGNAIANTYTGNTIFRINSNGSIEVARTSTGNSFAGNLSVIIIGNGEFRMGGNGGTTILSASSKFTLNSTGTSNILIQNIQQAPNGDSIVLNTNHSTDIFQNSITGKLIVNNTGNTVRLENNNLANQVSLSCNRIQIRENNVFGLQAIDSIFIQKNGWGHNDWFGGNTFNGVTTIVNNTPSSANQGRIIIARYGASGDTFNENLFLRNLNRHDLWLGYANTCFLNGNLSLRNEDADGRILLGRLNEGFLSISAGNALKNSGFLTGELRIDELTQQGTVANDSFNPLQFHVRNSNFGGDVSANPANNLSVRNSIFKRSLSFESNALILADGNTFNEDGGTTTITKNGWGNDDWHGGNIFYGNTTITNNSSSGNRRIQLSRHGSTGDVFHANLNLVNTGTGLIVLGHEFHSVVHGDLSLSNTNADGQIDIGRLNSGTVEILPDGALVNTGFSTGELRIFGLTQNGSAANDLFSPNQAIIQNSLLGGDLAIHVSNVLEISNVVFKQSASLEGASVRLLQGNEFNEDGGTTTITKNGWGNDDWHGGNIFHGNTTITNNSSSGNRRIQLSRHGSTGDVFHANLNLVNTGTGLIVLGHEFHSVVHGNLSLSNTNADGQIDIGRLNSGTVEILPGGALVNTGFSTGELRIFGLTQNGSAANDLFSPNQAIIQNSLLGGDLAIHVSNVLEISNVVFKQSASLEGASVRLLQGNEFNEDGGTTTITKNGWGNDDWHGGNIFHGNTTITNNSSSGDRRIQLSRHGSTGDVFHANLNLVNTGTGLIVLGHEFNSVVHGNLSLSNTNADGQIDIGRLNSGTVEILPGGALVNTGFSTGELRVFGLTQNGSAANDLFSPNQAIIQNSLLGGDLAIHVSNALEISNVVFKQSASLEGASVRLLQGNEFNEDGGTTTITKNGWGNDDWHGGNIFHGNTTILNNSSASQGQIFTARFGVAGDIFHADLFCTNNSEHLILIGHSNQTDIIGNVTLANALSNGAIRIGRVSGGNVVQQNGGVLMNGGFSVGELQLINFLQQGSGANDNFSPNELRIINSSFNGDFSATTVNTLEINQSVFKGNNEFSANNISLLNGSIFGDTITTTSITKTGSFNNDWQGGNTFFNTTITNNSLDRRIWMANHNKGDVFYGNTQFIRNTTAELVVARNDTSFFYGNISTIGSLQPVQFATSTGIMAFVGDSSKMFVAPSNQFVDLRRVAMLTLDTLFLLSPVNISQNLNLVQGVISNTSSAMLTLNNENVLSNLGSAQSHVDGVMQIQMANNSSSRRTLHFPLAKDGEYRPVLLEVAHTNNTSYTYRGEVILGNANDLGYALPLDVTHVSLVRHWKMERFQTNNMSLQPSANLRTQPSNRPQITLYYGASDGVTDPNNLVICKSDMTGVNWLNIGGFGSAPNTGFITSSSIPDLFDSFSDFTLGNIVNGINPLPVELLYLNAENFGDFNRITWATATEVNNDFFTLERSRDGFNFQELAIVQGSGNSNLQIDYEVIDNQPFSGINYYRLKQTDFDGTEEYFPIVSCVVEDGNTKIYPNPSNGKFFVETDLKELTVFGGNGNTVAQFILHDGQLNQIDLSYLSPGIYFLRLSADNRTESHRVVIQ